MLLTIITVMALGRSNTATRSGPDNSDPYKMLKKQNKQKFDHC